MNAGFFIKKISVQGQNMRPAELGFSRGANVITGLSDTGKSYVFSLLNYALGRSKEPKDIDESIGYSDVYMEIETYDGGKTYTIYRSLKFSNKIEAKECKLEVYKTSNANRKVFKKGASLDSEESFSNFLLGLTGLSGKKLLFSKRKGTTKGLSFSDLIQLTFISEQRVITEDSPFYFSAQNTNKIFEQSLLHLLLTGNDFSDVIQKEDSEKKENQIRGKLEFISYQVSQYSQERDEVVNTYRQEDLKFPYAELIAKLDQEVKENIDKANKITDEKNELIDVKQSVAKSLNYNSELSKRFNLLSRQYSSDLKRLEFITEAENLSSQLGDAICPICTSKLDSNHVLHLNEVADFKASILEEINKTSNKMSDLSEAIDRLEGERTLLEFKASKTDEAIKFLQNELKENFTPKIKELKTDLKNYWALENAKSKLVFIDTHVKNLYEEKGRLEKQLEIKQEQEEVNLLSFSVLSVLADKIKKRLQYWNYEPFVDVVFDSTFKVFDIVISGKSRRSHGKGKRAVSYSACLLGLLDYCMEKKFPFSNLIVIDSPLTTYKGKGEQTADAILAHDIEFSFFKDLASTSKNCQIIVFDNKIPDDTLTLSVNTTIFTRDKNVGRFGFFPI